MCPSPLFVVFNAKGTLFAPARPRCSCPRACSCLQKSGHPRPNPAPSPAPAPAPPLLQPSHQASSPWIKPQSLFRKARLRLSLLTACLRYQSQGARVASGGDIGRDSRYRDQYTAATWAYCSVEGVWRVCAGCRAGESAGLWHAYGRPSLKKRYVSTRQLEHVLQILNPHCRPSTSPLNAPRPSR